MSCLATSVTSRKQIIVACVSVLNEYYSIKKSRGRRERSGQNFKYQLFSVTTEKEMQKKGVYNRN